MGGGGLTVRECGVKIGRNGVILDPEMYPLPPLPLHQQGFTSSIADITVAAAAADKCGRERGRAGHWILSWRRALLLRSRFATYTLYLLFPLSVSRSFCHSANLFCLTRKCPSVSLRLPLPSQSYVLLNAPRPFQHSHSITQSLSCTSLAPGFLQLQP